MANKYTSGPWRRIDTADYAEIHSQSEPPLVIAMVGRAGDADLIELAPQLADTLEDFDNWFCGFNPEDQASRMEGRAIIIRARALLAKVKA